MAERERLLAEAAALLRTEPEHVGEAIERLLERQRAAEKSLEQARSGSCWPRPASLAPRPRTAWWWPGGTGSTPTSCATWPRPSGPGGLRVVVLGGSPDGAKASVAVAADGTSAHAGDLVKQIAPLLGGGGGGKPELAVAGGKDPSGIDGALDEARRLTTGA